MRTIKPSEMTYAELERALKPLGFAKKVVPQEKALVFSHNATDASIILPLRDSATLVSPLDLITVRKTVVEKGVATRARYEAYAQHARRNRRLAYKKMGIGPVAQAAEDGARVA